MQDEANEKRNLLSIGEASEYLGVSIDTLRRWEKKGRIEPYRSPGGHRHYSKLELDKLFDKKYVRDEPTVRSSGPYKEESGSAQASPAMNREEENSTLPPAPLNRFDSLPAENNNPNPYEPTPLPSTEYSLPPWRANTYVTETTQTEEPVKVDTPTPEVERPTRDLRVPEQSPVRVIQSEALLTSDEAYFRQQSVSILNPQPATPTTNPVNNNTYNPQVPSTISSNQVSDLKELNQNKNLIIYISAGIGILLLAITWFLLWRNSQSVLSPVP